MKTERKQHNQKQRTGFLAFYRFASTIFHKNHFHIKKKKMVRNKAFELFGLL